MKNDERKFLRKCLLTALLVIMAALALLWVADTMFDGALLTFFSVLIDSLFRGRWPLRSVLLGVGFLALLLVSAVGVLAAYRTYAAQHAQYLDARAEAERAQALAEAEMQRKSDLITYLAHDLKTPLASVIAYLNLLSESPELAPDQRAKYTGIALDKAYRLDQLTGELFEIIRFNLQTITLSVERINLRLMLLQLADEFYPLLLQEAKRIRVDCDEGLTLRGDGDKLARVFNNILKNAAAYSDAGTEIAVSARQADGATEVRFENRGEPIPERKLELIFEKFYRLDASRGTGTGGAGLGLAIAKEIVEAHGGTIRAESADGVTVFVVRVPGGGG